MRTKTPITAVGTVSPSSTESHTHTFNTDATLEGLWCSTYTGHEFDVQYTFELTREATGRTENLLEPLGKEFISGNGENHDMDIRHKVSQGDELTVHIENEDPDYTYHYQARIEWDKAGVTLFKSLFGGG